MSPRAASRRPAVPVVALGVVVPARDEGRRVSRCLGALAAAATSLRGAVPSPPALRTVLVADACTDGTADIARCWADVEVLVTMHGRVGAARAAGVAHLVDHWRRAGIPLDAAWIANTDADSVVPADWLIAQLAGASAGVDLLLGTVRPDLDDADPRVIAAWYRRHSLLDGHPHVHGANLGIRADMYCSVGGFAELPNQEDAALAAAVGAAGGVVERTATGPVRTSARTSGRTPGGLAGYLRDLRRSVAPPTADDPRELPA